MKKILALFSFVLIVLLIGCSRHDDIVTPVSAPKPDTLGTGWSKIIVGKGAFSDIFFINNSVGFLTGDSGTFKSVDGGLSWSKTAAINGNFMTATVDGKVFISTGSDTLYQSFNSGATFTGTKMNASSGQVTDICFTDKDSGYLPLGANDLRQTVNGGITWSKVTTVTGLNLGRANFLPAFVNASAGWISDQSNVFRTNGSLKNWVPCNFDVAPQQTGSSSCPLFAKSVNAVYLSAYNTTFVDIYKSTNGGANFNRISQVPITESAYFDLHFIDNMNGYLAASKQILQTTDGGVTWKKVLSLGESQIVEIHFTDADHGWACGANGTVLIFKR